MDQAANVQFQVWSDADGNPRVILARLKDDLEQAEGVAVCNAIDDPDLSIGLRAAAGRLIKALNNQQSSHRILNEDALATIKKYTNRGFYYNSFYQS